jgi:hypothetical protein
METHRLVSHCGCNIQPFDAPFSSFEYVERHFAGCLTIHRCFSLARSFSAKSVVIENILPVGLIAEENGELESFGVDPDVGLLKRLSFWNSPVPTEQAIDDLQDSNLIGYSILKCDRIPSGATTEDQWHVFEAVFRKYEHPHNCVPGAVGYRVRVGRKNFVIKGILYAQQNGLNKACAHVALRSLLSRLVSERDVSYAMMNRIARGSAGATFEPGQGLRALQIRAILDHYGINYRDVDYSEAEKADPCVRKTQPYQKYLYAGIESGCGGLLGFSMDGPKATGGRHIIPFYGHTFNKDTWVPDAQVVYFDIGGGVGYIPSESWTSSFLGHDDNVGPNFCIPRLYVKPKRVEYVVEILKPAVAYNGVVAEACALFFLYSISEKMDLRNPWQNRLAAYSRPDVQRVVLRALCVTPEQYLNHLKEIRDWDSQKENGKLVAALKTLLPKMLWVVEVSIPQLFPANERKLGEIVLDATRQSKSFESVDFSLFVFVRLPGQYVVMSGMSGRTPTFITAPSGLKSHVELMKH